MDEKQVSMPVGVVVRRQPGATRWAKWSWRVIGILPGAAPADWVELRRDGDVVDFHAGTLPLSLYRSDTEAYVTELAAPEPSVTVVFQKDLEGRIVLHAVTASPYEGQDYEDSGEELVERIAMPETLANWVREFVGRHHVIEPFVKRKRRKSRTDLKEDGIGDPRVRQTADIDRAPGSRKAGGS